jgi:copper chaperone
MIAMNRFAFENLFYLPAMVCECCVDVIAAAVRALDHAARVEADVAARTIRVISRHYETTILQALSEAGYEAEPLLQPLG